MHTFNTQINTSMLVDFYQLVMVNGYFDDDLAEKEVVFDLFFRNVPDNGGFAIMAGIEQLVQYINNIHFSNSDIEFLKSQNMFCEKFLNFLSEFKFSGDIWAIPEGTPVFPHEPIITIKGRMLEVQLIEAMLLLSVSHQILVATKASRMVRAASGRSVIEFGSRRAHGFSASLHGARAAYIGGCAASSNMLAGKEFSIPVTGTMTHSYIQMFEDELFAFKSYAKQYPQNCILLVDTYDALKSGIPNAIRAFNEEILPKGYRPKGIMIGSGDITYLSKRSRKLLDDGGFPDCAIIAANSLDEYIIRDMLIQGAKIDLFGVGERLISASSDPVLSLACKLVAVYDHDQVKNILKLSENTNKITTPGEKSVWRLFDRETGKALADVITFADETIDDAKPFEIFDPEHTWKRKAIDNFVARKLMKQIYKGGKLVYKLPKVNEIREYCFNQLKTIWEEILRFENPHKYYVDLSQKLWDERNRLITEYKMLKTKEKP